MIQSRHCASTAREVVAAAFADELAGRPTHDVRLVGCDRRSLSPVPAMGGAEWSLEQAGDEPTLA